MITDERLVTGLLCPFSKRFVLETAAAGGGGGVPIRRCRRVRWVTRGLRVGSPEEGRLGWPRDPHPKQP